MIAPTASEVGLSPCPNDTFMFHAWLCGLVAQDLPIRPWFADIEQLNRRALDPMAGASLALSKFSAATLATIGDRYRICSAGAALGRGCGPLVVRRVDRGPRSLGELRSCRVAIPGPHTTAAMLLKAFGSSDLELVELRFDRILDAVVRGDVAAGLIIHESRFTYRERGLESLADLGEIWEQRTGLPLPLGVIGVHRDVAEPQAWQRAMRASVEHAFGAPSASASFVAAHSQELSPQICAQHIALYVNKFSLDLGTEGRRAIEELIDRSGGDSTRLHWIDP